MFQSGKIAFFDGKSVDVTIVMPCLDEAQSLHHCINNARQALDLLAARDGLTGEILIADNGSTDGSQALAESLGARVVPVSERGYGAALIGGCHAAYGRYIVMGDCDGSYDFTDAVPMVAQLQDGHALCMGSRFDGGIAPGAMPWKNRYIGNPVLTGILNIFFRAGINDAHCGLRAIRKESFLRLGLNGTGMEFASEMVIKAALLRLPIAQVPAKLLPDLRDRAPHLRPWRDGWRHLRYLMMLAPNWLFGLPAIISLLLGTLILCAAGFNWAGIAAAPFIGSYWTIIGAACVSIGHLLMMMTCAGHVYALRSGYLQPGLFSRAVSRIATLETMLATGAFMALSGVTGLGFVFALWVERHFQATDSIFLPMLSILSLTMGMQTFFGGFLLAIIGGHQARFVRGAMHGPYASDVPVNHATLP